MKVDVETIEQKTGVDLLDLAINEGSVVNLICGCIDFEFKVTYIEYNESRTSYYPGGNFYDDVNVELLSAFYYDSEDKEHDITNRIELV